MPPRSFNEEILNAGEVDYEDKPLPIGKGAAAAVLSLLPIALGAAIKGKQGANAASKGAIYSAQILREGWEKDANRELTKALKESTLNSSMARSILSQSAQNQRSENSINAADERARLGRVASWDRMQEKLKGSNVPLTQEEADAIEAASGALISAKDVVGKTGKDVDRLAKLRNLDIMQGFAESRAIGTASNALSASTAAQKQADKVLAGVGGGGLDYTIPDVSETQKKEDQGLVQAYHTLSRLQDKLTALYEKNQGVPWTDWGEADKQAMKRDILSAHALVDWANVMKRGANFTIMEMNLGKESLATPASFLSYVTNGLLGKDNWTQASEYASDLNREMLLTQLGSKGAVIVGEIYPKDLADLFKIKTDKWGRALPPGQIQGTAKRYSDVAEQARRLAGEAKGSVLAPTPTPPAESREDFVARRTRELMEAGQ